MLHSLNLNFVDIAIIAIYFIFIFYVALRITNKGSFKNSDDYFLAGKDLSWFLVGASIFSSNIGSEHLIGLAGSGASTGVIVSQFELLACFILLLLGWFFVPFYLKSNIATMPEFLERRFSKSARNYLTFISIIAYILTKISVTIYAGAVVFEAIGVSFWMGAFVTVALTGAYTILGGLKAVIYTDAIQMVVMILGAILITAFGYSHFDSYQDLTSHLGTGFLSMWRPMSDPDFPWTGIIFGAPILGVWYWCTDQYVVQRALSAKNITEARRGSIFAGFLKILPLFIFVVPGILCFALSQKGLLNLSKPDLALPTLASFALPSGAKGIFIAGLLSALMSSLSSVFNSCSTLITYEVFKKVKPDASEKTLISIGRWSTFLLVILGVLWIPMMSLISGQLFKYIQSVQAYISPPIAAVFFLGLLWKRINSKGALVALYGGFILGITRLILEINKSSLDQNGYLYQFANINFLHFAAYLFVVSSFLMIIVSLLTAKEKIDPAFETRPTLDESPIIIRTDIILSVILVMSVFIIWYIFS